MQQNADLKFTQFCGKDFHLPTSGCQFLGQFQIHFQCFVESFFQCQHRLWGADTAAVVGNRSITVDITRRLRSSSRKRLPRRQFTTRWRYTPRNGIVFGTRNHRMTRTSVTSTHSIRSSCTDICMRQTGSYKITWKIQILWTATLERYISSLLRWQLAHLCGAGEWMEVEPLLYHCWFRLSNGCNRPMQSTSLSALQLWWAVDLTRTATVWQHSRVLLSTLHTTNSHISETTYMTYHNYSHFNGHFLGEPILATCLGLSS